MTISSQKGGLSMRLCDTLEALDILPGGSAQFVDTMNPASSTCLHVSCSTSSPRFHAAYRTHVTAPDYPSGRHFYVSWQGFLFFDNNQIIKYATITDGDFPEISTLQLFRLKQAANNGWALPESFEHATTTEFERLKLHLFTWRRLYSE